MEFSLAELQERKQIVEGHFTVGKWPGMRIGRAGGGSLMRTWLKRLLVGPRLEQGREANQKELILRVSQLRQAVGEPTRTQGEGAWGEPGKSKSRTKETTAADSPCSVCLRNLHSHSQAAGILHNPLWPGHTLPIRGPKTSGLNEASVSQEQLSPSS